MINPTSGEREQQQADGELDFEEHRAGRASKLEGHRVAIAKMRERSWPYRKIVEWLATEREVSATLETVRSFCRVRNIKKGIGEESSNRRRKAAPERHRPGGRPSNIPRSETDDPEERVFDFDDNLALVTRRNTPEGEGK